MGEEQQPSLLRQGAEGRIYQGLFLGRKCIIKERFPKTYRHPALDERLTKERMRAELRGLLRSRTVGIRTPAIYFVDTTRNAIVMELIENVDTVNVHIGKVLEVESIESREEWLKTLARGMGCTVAKLHAAGIIHGDLTTSNILVNRNTPSQETAKTDPPNSIPTPSLCLIDFGLSHVETSAEDKGVDLYVLERALTSTFPSIPWFFEELLKTYRSTYLGGGGEEVYTKLEEIRLRGRKRTMVG